MTTQNDLIGIARRHRNGLYGREVNQIAQALLIAYDALEDYIESCKGFDHKPHCYCLPAVEALSRIRSLTLD